MKQTAEEAALTYIDSIILGEDFYHGVRYENRLRDAFLAGVAWSRENESMAAIDAALAVAKDFEEMFSKSRKNHQHGSAMWHEYVMKTQVALDFQTELQQIRAKYAGEE